MDIKAELSNKRKYQAELVEQSNLLTKKRAELINEAYRVDGEIEV